MKHIPSILCHRIGSDEIRHWNHTKGSLKVSFYPHRGITAVMLTQTVYGTWIYGFNTARAPGRFGIIAAGTIPPRMSTDVRLLRWGKYRSGCKWIVLLAWRAWECGANPCWKMVWINVGFPCYDDCGACASIYLMFRHRDLDEMVETDDGLSLGCWMWMWRRWWHFFFMWC